MHQNAFGGSAEGVYSVPPDLLVGFVGTGGDEE